METFKSFESKLYGINDATFTDIALGVFRFQAAHNAVYKAFVDNLSINPQNVSRLEDIPFLPIAFFKTHAMQTGEWIPEAVFTSSGTTGVAVSRHPVRDVGFYLRHSERCFEHFFGPLTDYHFLALLPSYLERQGSSLIAMMDHFIKTSGSPHSGFYLYTIDTLLADLEKLKHDSRKVILWGVSFALLDLVEQHHPDLSHCLIFETGGMKGRRREITRAELHSTITEGPQRKVGLFRIRNDRAAFPGLYKRSFPIHCAPWMKVIGREITDPLTKGILGETAALNVIDLANWNTISFLETEDLGRVYANGTFEVLGRMDNSDVRGCNLMVG